MTRRRGRAAAAVEDAAATPLITEAESKPRDRAHYEAVMYPVVEGALFLKTYTGDSALFDFIREKGRMPFLSDEKRPWAFRGWMLPQLFLMYRGTPSVQDRYGYHVRTLQEGRLLDEPIEPVHYGEALDGSSPVYKSLIKLCDGLGRWHGYNEGALAVFLDWLAWALGLEAAAPKFITDETNEYLYRTFNFGEWIIHPSDYIGLLLTEYRSHSTKQRSGFFVTPHNICEMMVRMVLDGGSMDMRSKTVMEPAVGTGRFLLHAANYSMRLYGQDIDATCVKATKINLAMYAPWGAWPLPARFWRQYDEAAFDAETNVATGDTLREPAFFVPGKPGGASPRTPPPERQSTPSVVARESAPPSTVVTPFVDVARAARELAERAAATHAASEPVSSAAAASEPEQSEGLRTDLFGSRTDAAGQPKGRRARGAKKQQPRAYNIHESQGSLFGADDADE